MISTEDIEIRCGLDNMNCIQITKMLENAFWCKGIKISEVEKGMDNSALVVGAFSRQEEQVGFARVISDKTRFAYILDVIVRDDYRRKGIGKQLINFILKNEALKDVYQWLLVTRDAHEVYRKVGFSEISRPNDWMEIRYQRPER